MECRKPKGDCLKREMTGLEILKYMSQFNNSQEYFRDISSNKCLFEGIEVDSNISKEELDAAFRQSLHDWKVEGVDNGTET